MTTYKTDTHQNLAVWARRLGMELNDLDRGAAFADSLFKQPSRRGVLIALAIRYMAHEEQKPLSDAGIFSVGVTMGNLLYDRVYGEKKYENIAEGFRDEMLMRVREENMKVTHNQVCDLIALHHAKALDWVSKGIYSRSAERAQPGIVNAILAKVRG
ncbi:hypothetical protein D3C80_1579290 [compost metagenome]